MTPQRPLGGVASAIWGLHYGMACATLGLHSYFNPEAPMTELDITRTIDIKAPATKVWAALTEADLIAQWFGDAAEFDASPGGTGMFAWRADGHGPFRVLVERADKPKTLVYRWAREANVDPVPGNSTVVRFDLAEIDGGTRLTLVESGFEALDDPKTASSENTEGWKSELGELVEFVESR